MTNWQHVHLESLPCSSGKGGGSFQTVLPASKYVTQICWAYGVLLQKRISGFTSEG